MQLPSNFPQQSSELGEAFSNGRKYEKQRISRELHDGLAQELLSIRMRLLTLELLDLPPQHAERFFKINVDLYNTLNTLNGIIKDQVPAHLMSQSFDQIVRQTFEDQTVVHIEIKGHTRLKFHEKGIAKEILRILQEFVRNSIKHAKASKITIQLKQLTKGIRVHVLDNGIGFATDEVQHGMGINNIQFRLKSIGANYEYSSSKQSGTQLIFAANEINY